MREKTLQEIINFLNKLGYFEIVNEPDKFEMFIQGLTPEQAKNILITFNRKLRTISKSEEGFYTDGYMGVGDHMAPQPEIQDKIIEKLLVAVKQLNDNNERAALVYYTLLNLHPFRDGNGRTARLMYDLITGNTLFDENIDWYIHDENNNALYTRSFILSFEELNGLIPISELNDYVSNTLLQQLEKRGIILPDDIKNKNFRTYTEGMYQDYAETPIPKDIEQQLTENEKYDFHQLIFDSEGKYSIGGLTMLIMSANKGQHEDCYEHYQSAKNKIPSTYFELVKIANFTFSFSDHPEILGSWSKEDFLEAIAIAKELKETQITNQINLFTDPENYKTPNNETIKSKIFDSTNKSL